jgi:hypothetical protein
MPAVRSQVATVRRPKTNDAPPINTGNRQRFVACNPAANHPDHSFGDSQRRPGFAIRGPPIMRFVCQLQHDGRAIFIGDQLLAFSRKVQNGGNARER